MRALILVVALSACASSRPGAEPEAKPVVVVPRASAAPEPEDEPAPKGSPARGGWSSRLAACKTDAAPEDRAAARQLFQDGVKAYEEGDYGKVAELFAKAYERSCASPVLFNLGTALERAGDRSGAVEVFELFLEKSPTSPQADEVRRRIETLRRAE